MHTVTQGLTTCPSTLTTLGWELDCGCLKHSIQAGNGGPVES